MRRSSFFLIAAIAASPLLNAADAPAKPERISVSKTETADFPAGGELRIAKSLGELTIEAWDRPGAEIVTTKFSKLPVAGKDKEKAEAELALVKFTHETRDNQLVLNMDYPRPRRFPPASADGTPVRIGVECHIRVPRDTRIAIDNHSGEVHIDGVTGDVSAHAREGEITLHLPQDGSYAIDARSKFGHINSDFDGDEKHRWWRTTRFMAFSPSGAAHKLHLRVGYGDIVILKTTTPKLP